MKEIPEAILLSVTAALVIVTNSAWGMGRLGRLGCSKNHSFPSWALRCGIAAFRCRCSSWWSLFLSEGESKKSRRCELSQSVVLFNHQGPSPAWIVVSAFNATICHMFRDVSCGSQLNQQWFQWFQARHSIRRDGSSSHRQHGAKNFVLIWKLSSWDNWISNDSWQSPFQGPVPITQSQGKDQARWQMSNILAS